MQKPNFITYILVLALLAGCKLQQPAANSRLHQAVLTGDAKAVKKFLVKGASVNYQEEKRGWTPLLFAVEQDNAELVKILVDHGADVNMISTKNRVSSLQRAASKGNIEIMKMLITKGADLDHQDAQLRSTPLMWTAVNGHEDAARLLLDNGALINARGNRGESALFLAVSAEKANMVSILISYDVIKDRPDIYGKTPMQKATELNNREIVNLLSN